MTTTRNNTNYAEQFEAKWGESIEDVPFWAEMISYFEQQINEGHYSACVSRAKVKFGCEDRTRFSVNNIEERNDVPLTLKQLESELRVWNIKNLVIVLTEYMLNYAQRQHHEGLNNKIYKLNPCEKWKIVNDEVLQPLLTLLSEATYRVDHAKFLDQSAKYQKELAAYNAKFEQAKIQKTLSGPILIKPTAPKTPYHKTFSSDVFYSDPHEGRDNNFERYMVNEGIVHGLRYQAEFMSTGQVMIKPDSQLAELTQEKVSSDELTMPHKKASISVLSFLAKHKATFSVSLTSVGVGIALGIVTGLLIASLTGGIALPVAILIGVAVCLPFTCTGGFFGGKAIDIYKQSTLNKHNDSQDDSEISSTQHVNKILNASAKDAAYKMPEKRVRFADEVLNADEPAAKSTFDSKKKSNGVLVYPDFVSNAGFNVVRKRNARRDEKEGLLDPSASLKI